jgi:hypothetical protein
MKIYHGFTKAICAISRIMMWLKKSHIFSGQRTKAAVQAVVLQLSLP